uniref:SCAN box domain-containing protein n=1 Tax=Pelusios castaneus TaxID=367368 RepID=A0A8C8S2Y0_9SAUR
MEPDQFVKWWADYQQQQQATQQQQQQQLLQAFGEQQQQMIRDLGAQQQELQRQTAYRALSDEAGIRPWALAQELKDACCRWLQPDQHSKEELIDQVVMEQFLHAIPSRGRTWVMRHRPVSLNDAVRRLEDFLAAENPGGWMGSTPATASVTGSWYCSPLRSRSALEVARPL